MKLPHIWTQHCKDEEDAKRLRKYLENSQEIFEVIRSVLDAEYERLEYTSRKDYKSAAWPYYQAHTNGEREAIDRIRKLLPEF